MMAVTAPQTRLERPSLPRTLLQRVPRRTASAHLMTCQAEVPCCASRRSAQPQEVVTTRLLSSYAHPLAARARAPRARHAWVQAARLQIASSARSSERHLVLCARIARAVIVTCSLPSSVKGSSQVRVAQGRAVTASAWEPLSVSQLCSPSAYGRQCSWRGVRAGASFSRPQLQRHTSNTLPLKCHPRTMDIMSSSHRRLRRIWTCLSSSRLVTWVARMAARPSQE